MRPGLKQQLVSKNQDLLLARGEASRCDCATIVEFKAIPRFLVDDHPLTGEALIQEIDERVQTGTEVFKHGELLQCIRGEDADDRRDLRLFQARKVEIRCGFVWR